MLHKISLIIFVLIGVGCMKVQKKNSDKNQPPISVGSQTLEAAEKFSYEYDFSLNAPQIVFRIPPSWGDLVVIEKSKAGEKIFQKEIGAGQRQWSDFLFDDNKFTYKFFRKDDATATALEELEILPALDLAVDSDVDLAARYALNPKVKKLYFKNLQIRQNARIFIGSFDGQIVIEKLNSDRGILQTFPTSQRAPFGHDGRSVGGFELLVLSGQGGMAIHLQAEAGGDGIEGREPDAALVGATGGEGPPPFFKEAGETNCAGNVFCTPMPIRDCVAQIGPGQDGGPGKRGYPGGDAGHGGAVKKIKIQNRTDQVQLDVIAQPGKKGIGGRGGRGGQGGPGGPGSDGGRRGYMRASGLNPDNPVDQMKANMIALGKNCEPAQQGRTGERGETGINGHDGSDGRVD